MLGSHNSCTYLPCKKWWMYLISWTAKCQSKSLTTQFIEGVRYFDIRVKYENNSWVLAHGLIEYKTDINEIISHLNDLAAYTGERVYVRFLLEYNKIPDDFATKIIKLQEYVKWARSSYHCLTYHCVMLKWNEHVTDKFIDLEVKHTYSSILGWKRFFWIPYWYAKFHNKKFREDNKEILESKDRVLLMDFVNIK